MSKRILYLTYYFEPDLGAGSFRNAALVKRLSEVISTEDKIEVLCTMPNRYTAMKIAAKDYESYENLSIHRFKVSKQSNSFLSQIKSFLQYRKQVIQYTRERKYDLVFASSSKLFTAYLAYKIANINQTRLYIDLRDLFAENLKELFPTLGIGKLLSYIIKRWFEKPCLEYAYHLNVNSGGFLNDFNYRKSNRISFFPNGIDDFFIHQTQNKDLPLNPKVITYAGNIGDGQGLEKIIPSLALRLGADYKIQLIGDGNSVLKLKKEITDLQLLNVRIIPPVERKTLLEYYRNSHYLFLHLNTFKSFEKVIPSKIFEYAALNIPILAGVSGYPARFIKEEVKNNVFVFEPCDPGRLHNYLLNSRYKLEERPDFVEKYQRKAIADAMANSIKSCL